MGRVNPVDRRRAERLGIEPPSPIYASLEHIVTRLPTGIARLPAAVHVLDVPDAVKHAAGADGWRALNPSIAMHSGTLHCCVRLWEGWLGGNMKPRNATVFGRIDEDWRLVDQRPMRALDGNAYEDLRLFAHGAQDGAIGACATSTSHGPLHGMALLALTPNADIQSGVGFVSKRIEKNWMPCADGDRLRFVFALDPKLVVRDYDSRARGVVPSADKIPAGGGYLRGSTPLIPYEGGRLAVVHERWYNPRANQRYYLHRFARFNAALTAVTIGQLFYFQELGIEFCAGLARWRDQFVISYGFQDRQACLALVTDETIRAFAPGAP